EKTTDVVPYGGHACGASDENHAFELAGLHAGVPQSSTASAPRTPEEGLGPGRELGAARRKDRVSSSSSGQGHLDGGGVRQPVLELSRHRKQEGHDLAGDVPLGVEPNAGQHVPDDFSVEVVPSELTVSTRAPDLEHAVLERKDRDVEGTSGEVVAGEGAIFPLLQTVRKGRRRGCVEQAKHLETRQLGSITRGL